jgi:glycosyltransferase involved in cell wall biosynthesis
MPKVSVLVPCFNAELFVARTLDSLRSQTFEDWECIVVDDGSTDDSAAIVRSYVAHDARIVLLRQPNAGVCRARNSAYAASSEHSKYVLFLDSDDCLEPTMLDVLVSYLDRHADVCLAFCAFACIGEADELIPANDPRLADFVPTRFVPSGLGLRALPPMVAETPFTSIFSAWAGLLPSNSLLRRSVYNITPGWDESFGQSFEDTDVFLHMALRGGVHYVPLKLLQYRRHSGQSTADRMRPLAQNRKLFLKWAQIEGLTSRELAVLRAARSFRETRLLPYWSLRIAASHLRNGNLVEGTKSFLRAVRQFWNGTRMLNAPV